MDMKQIMLDKCVHAQARILSSLTQAELCTLVRQGVPAYQEKSDDEIRAEYEAIKAVEEQAKGTIPGVDDDTAAKVICEAARGWPDMNNDQIYEYVRTFQQCPVSRRQVSFAMRTIKAERKAANDQK